MTDILCRWLNDELNLSQPVDPKAFARDFASGYLIGEVLYKYQLQDDFDQFSQNRTADSKLNNFTRIEPVLHLLGIPFDTNVARDIITEKHGVATRLMYQLFIALTNKKKANLTGVAMETMRPSAPANLNNIQSGLYKERLKHITPRQTDLNLEALASHFHEKRMQMEETAFKERFEEEERHRQMVQSQRQQLLERARDARNKQSEMIAKIQAASVHIPKPPAHKSSKAIAARKAELKKKEAQETFEDIGQFEKRMKMILPPSKMMGDDGSSEATDMEVFAVRADEEGHVTVDAVELIKTKSNDDYIGKIRKRLNEDESARKEREKRRRKVLVDQMKAHQAQEEARREEMLVNRLMRQSQQERRIAVQLLQARLEKEVIRKNRMIREQQYEERRLRDFEEAMNRENEMARLAKLEYEEQIRKDQELHDKLAAERAEAKYRRHYESCQDVLLNMVDFACKVAEYRELTDKLVPPKLIRDWSSLFVAGQPLFEVTAEVAPAEITAEQVLEEEKQKLLDEGDFMEYKNMVGEWQPKENCEVTGPPRDNPIIGHVIQRIYDMVNPPTPTPPAPKFPPFPIKACVLGKLFSGKTSCIQKLAEEHRLQLLNSESLIEEAIQAFKDGEIEVLPPEEEKPVEEEGSLEAPKQLPTEPSSTPGTIVTDAETTAGEVQAKDDKASDISKSKEETPSEPQSAGEQPVPTTPQDPPQTASTSSLPASAKTGSEQKTAEAVKSEPELSARAKLGGKAAKCLKRGRPVDDPIVVEILVEAIRQVPEGTGWVLDGYPTNYTQAKLLEKALTGFDATAKDKQGGKGGQGKRASTLVPDPRPPPPPAEPTSGIDVVILLDVPDDFCLKRASGRYQSLQKDEHYHQEFKPPPEGSATGMGKQDRVIPVEDPAHDQEQVQYRITGFLDSWAKLAKWYNKFGNLRVIDASQPMETVHLEVEKVFEETLAKLQGPKEEPESIPVPSEEATVEKVEEKPAEVPPEPEPKEEVVEEKVSKKGSRTGSGKSRSSSKESGGRAKSKSPKRENSAKKSDSGKKSPKSRESSPKSKRAKSGKKTKTPEPEPEPEVPVEPPGPPPPQPGSEEWVFVDEPLSLELAQILAKHWEVVENTYISNGKFMFRKVREERENIIRYFYQIRQDYLAYLRRPDHKQEFVTQWQKDYNSIPDDMRDDEETKAELHQRTDDLRERLWSICDERKEQAEEERMNIMADGWLEDRLGILSNHYITLMQCEVDRFQDTVRLTRDYYRGMEGHVPDETNPKFARLPLIELPVERPNSPDRTPATSEGAPSPSPNPDEPPSTPKDKAKSPQSKSPQAKSPTKDRSHSPKGGAKSRTPSGKRRDRSKEKKEEKEGGAAEVGMEPKRPRIPLVPRRAASPDPAAMAKGKMEKKPVKKGEAEMSDSPSPQIDLDEKLISDSYSNAIAAVTEIMAKENAAREAELEAERQKELEKAREAEKTKNTDGKKAKGGAPAKKGGKSRSPSPKKGKKEADVPTTPVPEAAEETEEEKAKRLMRSKMREEYYFAIQEEETATKTRLELIRAHASGIIQELKASADNAYKDMNDWLGARFLKEMESIDHMSEVIRHAIENKEKIKQEIILQQEDFLVNEEVKVLRSPSPIPPPPPVEPHTADLFTVTQLLDLYKQFMQCAPSGVMSSKSFVEVFENLVAMAQGMETLPDAWMNISPAQIQDMCAALAGESEYVDWRRFLLALLHPIPQPTQAQLLDTLVKFQEMEQKSTGYVSREQYDQMDLWFSTSPSSDKESGEQTGEPGEFNRLLQLKKSLFDLYADHSRDPPGLEYVFMLLYFSAAADHNEGFFRALSVASGTHMPHSLPLPASTAPALESIPADLQNLEDSVTKAIPDDPTITKQVSEAALGTEDPAVTVPVKEDIPDSAQNALVPLDALYRVLHHGRSSQTDSHRYSTDSDPEDSTSREKLLSVYQELGDDVGSPIPFRVLLAHPLIQDVITACQVYKLLDVKSILHTSLAADHVDTGSTKTSD